MRKETIQRTVIDSTFIKSWAFVKYLTHDDASKKRPQQSLTASSKNDEQKPGPYILMVLDDAIYLRVYHTI